MHVINSQQKEITQALGITFKVVGGSYKVQLLDFLDRGGQKTSQTKSSASRGLSTLVLPSITDDILTQWTWYGRKKEQKNVKNSLADLTDLSLDHLKKKKRKVLD